MAAPKEPYEYLSVLPLAVNRWDDTGKYFSRVPSALIHGWVAHVKRKFLDSYKHRDKRSATPVGNLAPK